jgi:hypothetical protein
MTSNTEVAMLDYSSEGKPFGYQQAVALSPFKAFNASQTAFRPPGPAKGSTQSTSSSDQLGKRMGFQLVSMHDPTDKENARPTLSNQKKRMQTRIVQNIEQKVKAPTEEVEAQFPLRSKNTRTFSLKQFNSIFIGRRPLLDSKSRTRSSIYQIKSSKPTHCSVKVNGLTIQVKIAN